MNILFMTRIKSPLSWERCYLLTLAKAQGTNSFHFITFIILDVHFKSSEGPNSLYIFFIIFQEQTMGVPDFSPSGKRFAFIVYKELTDKYNSYAFILNKFGF